MALPTPESLAPGVVTLERALALLQRRFADRTFTVTSADPKVTAVARGTVDLESLTIDAANMPLGATALARKVLLACSQALAQASADSAAAAAADAAGYALPGLPAPGLPPPSDSGFDGEVGRAMGFGGVLRQAIAQMSFEGTQLGVRAVVDGTLELRTLVYAPPLPESAEDLATATVTAVNRALGRAKGLFQPTAGGVVDDVTGPGGRTPLPDPRPRALLVVENAATLRASDQLLRARLHALGFEVETRKAPTSATADANGRTLIVISESVNPEEVGTKFTSSAVPMVVCEPVSFRDLKMTGGVWGTDKGDAVDQTQLQITAGHPLAAGLSGTVTVTTAKAKFVWGKPAAAAVKVAGIVGKTNQWGIFAYDTGDAMVGIDAPARRVGFFAGQNTPALLNEAGWRLFDAAVRWATAARALLTVAAGALGAGDLALKRRLEERHGLEVLVRPDGDTRTSDLRDLRVHVISESVSTTNISNRFLTSPAPTVVCDANLFDDMKLTGAVRDTDFGEIDGQSELEVTAGSPLSAGLGGRVATVSSGQRFAWGRPAAEAIKAAAVLQPANAFGIFAYEGGANMVGTRAPAARVGFFAAKDAPAAFTPEGFALFDAAVRWARRPRTLFLVGTLPLRPDDEAIRKRLEESFGFVVDVRLARDSALAHANGKHVVLLSESASSGDVGSRFTGVAVPLVSLQPALFDDLKMTGTVANTDFGVSADQIELDLVKADHPLAAGLAVGRVQVAAGTARLGWGKAGVNAVKIARIVGSTDRWALFGYENGASMVGVNAPARRVGCFVAKDTIASLNENGLRLFDAAISWAAGRIELFSTPPSLGDVVTGSPSTRTAWQVGVLYRVGDEVSFEGLDYRCRQQHTSQIDWKPPLTPALWERINAGLMWAVQVFYKVGDEVMFEGNRYRCIQAHQSQSDWTPPATPTLWQRI